MKKENLDRGLVVTRAGVWFIVTNFLLAGFNALIGVLSGSLAILSDAVHSLIDAVSGILIIGSEKLSRKFQNKRVKIERVATIIIALIIIAAGVDIIVDSTRKLIEPEEVEYSVWTIVVLIGCIAVKYALARYLKIRGKKYKSDVLTASGAETLNDTWISVAVLLSAVIYMIFRVDIEAYVSLFIAILIIKVGLEFIFPHLSHHHHHPLEENPDHDHCGKR